MPGYCLVQKKTAEMNHHANVDDIGLLRSLSCGWCRILCGFVLVEINGKAFYYDRKKRLPVGALKRPGVYLTE